MGGHPGLGAHTQEVPTRIVPDSAVDLVADRIGLLVGHTGTAGSAEAVHTVVGHIAVVLVDPVDLLVDRSRWEVGLMVGQIDLKWVYHLVEEVLRRILRLRDHRPDLGELRIGIAGERRIGFAVEALHIVVVVAGEVVGQRHLLHRLRRLLDLLRVYWLDPWAMSA
jgi:hypothetical protein